MTYRRAIATGLLLLSLAGCTASLEGTDGDRYSQTCRTASEDSAIPEHCKLDPTARYEYDRGAWHTTTRETAPTGAELLAFDPATD